MIRFVVTAGAVLLALTRSAGAAPLCVGDCDEMNGVTVDELVRAVIVAAGGSPQACLNADGDGDSIVTRDELVAGVDNLLLGCPSYLGVYSATVDLDAGRTASIEITSHGGGTAEGVVKIYEPAGGGSISRLLGGAVARVAEARLSGFINLETGQFSLAGSFLDEHGHAIPIDVSGSLPLRMTGQGVVTVNTNGVPYQGAIRAGALPAAPTPTSTRAPATATRTSPPLAFSPTPTATATPLAATPTPTTGGGRPTPPQGCDGGGYVVATFSNASGTNANQPLTGSVEIFAVSGTVVTQPVRNAVGGNALFCLGSATAVRRFQWRMLNVFGTIPVGQPISLDNSGHTMLEQYFFDYLETPIANPLGTVGWRAKAGTFTIDSIEGQTVKFHVTDAIMHPEPSFSYSSPATGTFTLNLTGTIDSAVFTP